jgi:hypothetical protein
MRKDWAYNYEISSMGFYSMISQTNAFTLYHYLASIPNVSMIDNSCESHTYDMNQKLTKLKQLRDSYRDLGPNVGRKLVRKTTREIYRIEGQIKTDARGKQTKKRKQTKRKQTKNKYLV